MKNLFFIISSVAFLMIGNRGSAQQPQEPAQNQESDANTNGVQKVEALKVAFISQKLNLTPEEAEKFWPLYNSYQKEMEQLVEERKQFQLNNKTAATASDAQVGQSLDEEFAFRQKALAIQQKYKNEFLKVLPPRKVYTFYKSEGDFNKQLIRELRNRGSMPQYNNRIQNEGFRQPAPMMRPRGGGGGGGRR